MPLVFRVGEGGGVAPRIRVKGFRLYLDQGPLSGSDN